MSSGDDDKRVTLRDVQDAGGTRRLEAFINHAGRLVISGQDLGPATSSFWGGSEYEWSRSVKPADFPKLAAELGLPTDATSTQLLDALGEQYSGSAAMGVDDMLERSGADVSKWSRVGE